MVNLRIKDIGKISEIVMKGDIHAIMPNRPNLITSNGGRFDVTLHNCNFVYLFVIIAILNLEPKLLQ